MYVIVYTHIYIYRVYSLGFTVLLLLLELCGSTAQAHCADGGPARNLTSHP